MTEFVTGFAFGCLFGFILAPLRLAGVDYSKWYRNPGEISERDDRSWIGLMKRTALYTGNPFVIVALIVAIAAIVLHCLANCLPGWLQFRALLLVLDWLGSWAFGGLLIGIVVVQGAVEALWRCRTLAGHRGVFADQAGSSARGSTGNSCRRAGASGRSSTPDHLL